MSANRKTKIEWERYDDRATVFTDERAIVRRLLRHPLFESEQVLESDDEPIAVEGTFPIAAIKFCSLTRKETGHARVVPYDAQEKREWAKKQNQEGEA